MTRYFFHLVDEPTGVDLEGTELPDVTAARRSAIEMAGEMMRHQPDRFLQGKTWRLAVTTGDGSLVFSLTANIDDPVFGSIPEPRIVL